ncbi:hypothetical protein BCY91_12200 [Pelobium manganitolerans]|uniref:Glycosyltransferase 2-like domain-containing protein n=1 Tax=Pelobium manganitolerans TaxID=1842495 RepID=A0A419S1Q4_9SPHI|nr:glycosyltransferase family 2 protein [Pelobium manganitolerans]RKD12405.1 hypothetical protein BCY91_12200 [Pelobium manganitolerans]
MKISVITPSFNSGKTLERAIQSVVKQSYQNWEHLVVDGNSTDNTAELLKKYPHVKSVSEDDKGQSDAMNKGFEMSTGELILYLNADDELHPEALTNFSKTFKANPSADMVVADVKVVKEDGKSSIDTPTVSLSKILFYWPCKFPLNPVSYCYRRAVQTYIGHFPVDNHLTMDYWFLVRAFLDFKIKKANFIGGVFYFSVNNKSADAERARISLKQVRDSFVKRYFYRSQVIKFIFRRLYGR